MWAMATAMRLVGDKEDKGTGGKGNGNSDVNVAGKEENGGRLDCNGNKRAMAMMRVAGKHRQLRQKGQWQQQ